MKKVITRIFTAICVAISLVFATITTPLTSNVYADEPNDPVNTPLLEAPLDETPADESTESNDTEDTDQPTDQEGTTKNPNTGKDDEQANEDQPQNVCTIEAGALQWVICSAIDVTAKITDTLYSLIQDLLVVQPVTTDDNSPLYIVWQYARNLTNIVFIILLLIVIYSQITGLGINNYGIKRVLPRLIIAVVLVNLSYIICSVTVDASNILGSGLRGFFDNIQNAISANANLPELSNFNLSFVEVLNAILSGGAIAGIAVGAAAGGAGGLFWSIAIILIGAVVSIASGLLTIAARQAVVALLIMIAPLAFVAYLLPNTETWFNKWKNLFFRMLIFYPLFSFLFGASKLAGWALIITGSSTSNAFWIIMGLAVQVFPLFFSWQLMKMSGTFLSAINSGFRKLAAPAQRAATDWASSHRERARQDYFSKSTAPGANLRRYLDRRRMLREKDTENSLSIRKNRALEYTYRQLSSSTGHDAAGNDTWQKHANKYTRNAKIASIYTTQTENEQAAHKSTLSSYNRHFKGTDAKRLSDQHTEAYLDSMKQQFLTANEAQSDQELLLNQYIQATVDHKSNPTQFNRLVKGAAGSLGHTGEASIMGQVIVGNAQIEQRRRSEARIIINKFGIKKPQFRAMVFDKAGMDDNGYALDKNGNVIENDQYRLKPGKAYDEWQDYIGVHKDTGDEITKVEYDALSSTQRTEYKKVRFFDITDDKDGLIQRVYEDDAGYMKELLTDDIFIGDPINRRYLTEIGIDADDKTKTGILRRYHSTITAAMLASKYKEHAAEVTPMITAQTNMGYVTSIGQYNIANLQSLSVASKAGSINISDGYALDTWAKLLTCTDDQLFKKYFPKINLVDSQGNPLSAFEYYFPDADIMSYRNVNGQLLGGLRKQADGTWLEIDDPNDPSITLEERKELLKRKILPKAAAKLVSAFNRRMSPNILENQKNDTLKAISSLLDVLSEIGLKNMDPDTPPDQILGKGDNNNIFDSQDPDIAQKKVRETQAAIKAIIDRNNGSSDDADDSHGPIDPPSGGGPHSDGPSGSPSGDDSASSHPGISRTREQLNRQQRAFSQQQAITEFRARNSYTNIIHEIDSLFATHYTINELYQPLLDYFGDVENLSLFVDDCQQLLDDAMQEDILDSTLAGITQIVNRNEREQARKAQLYTDVINLVGQANTY